MTLKFLCDWCKPQKIVVQMDNDSLIKILEKIDSIAQSVAILTQEVKKMSTDQQGLDAAITQLQQDDAALVAQVSATGTAVAAALADLLAKIAANPTAPAADFTSEVNTLTQMHTDFTTALTSLQQSASAATADDPGSQVTPPSGT